MELDNISKMLIKRYQSDFVSLLSILGESVDLVIEKELAPFLDLIAPIQLLKLYKIEKIFYLEPEMNVGNEKRLYLLRPSVDLVKDISQHFNYDKKHKIYRKFLIIFMPQKTTIVEELLESYGMLDSVQVYEWHVELIPLDFDLFSLEKNDSLSHYLNSDYSSIVHLVVSSIYTLFEINNWNMINIHCLGELSHHIFDVFNYLRILNPPTFNKDKLCLFTDLILIDRRIDLVSPILTQLSYEGLLDDYFGINYGSVTLNEKILENPKPIKLLLNSNDPTYKLVRGCHISFLFRFIKNELKKLINRYDEGRQQSTISEMKTFVGELKHLKPMERSLVAHLCACESITKVQLDSNNKKILGLEHALLRRDSIDDKLLIKFFDDMLCSQSKWQDFIRLLCLYSMLGVSNTKERKRVIYYAQRNFFRAHGNTHVNTFFNLKKIGMLDPQDDYSYMLKSAFNKLNLIPNSKFQTTMDLTNPIDSSFVYSGSYKPFSCTLLESFFKQHTWNFANELIEHIGMEIFTDSIQFTGNIQPESNDCIQKKYLIYFLGGCSYSEVNAIRFLSKQFNIIIGVATTNLIGKNSIFDSLNHEMF